MTVAACTSRILARICLAFRSVCCVGLSETKSFFTTLPHPPQHKAKQTCPNLAARMDTAIMHRRTSLASAVANLDRVAKVLVAQVWARSHEHERGIAEMSSPCHQTCDLSLAQHLQATHVHESCRAPSSHRSREGAMFIEAQLPARNLGQEIRT